MKVFSTSFSREWEIQTEASLIGGVILLFVLNFADWLSSLFLRSYYQEGNPLMAAIMNKSPLVSLAVKMTITLLVCWLLIYAYMRGPKQYSKIGLVVLNLFYSIVVGNNCLLFILTKSPV